MSQDGQNLNLPWFRFYRDFKNDDRIQRLSEADQRRYIMLLCLRAERDFTPLSDDDFAWHLGISKTQWLRTKNNLHKRQIITTENQTLNLLDWDRHFRPHDFSKLRRTLSIDTVTRTSHRKKTVLTTENEPFQAPVDLDQDLDKDVLDHHHHDLDLSTPPNFVKMLEPYFEGLSFGGATNVKMFSMFKDWEAIGVIEGDFLTARDFLIEKQIFPTSPLYYHRMVIDFAKCRLKNNNYDKVMKKKETPLDKYVREEKERTGIDIREAALGSVSERSN